MSTQDMRNEVGEISGRAQSLLSTAEEATSEGIGETRNRLRSVLVKSKAVYGRTRERAVAGCKATDEAVHRHPYQAIGIAAGLGLLLACFAPFFGGKSDLIV